MFNCILEEMDCVIIIKLYSTVVDWQFVAKVCTSLKKHVRLETKTKIWLKKLNI